MTGPMIRLYVDDARHACGERTFVLVREGRKHAHLLDPYTLDHLTVPKERLRHAQPSAVTPAQARRRLRTKAKDWKRYGFKMPGALIKEAIGVLKTA